MAKAVAREGWPRTVAEFEVWHARQPERWAFYEGAPYLMAPASMPHSIIKGNVFAALRAALAGTSCHPLVDGPQILTDEISAIPAVAVGCVPIDLSTPVVAAPAIIVEVMSPSTEYDDGGRKWWLSQDPEPHAISRPVPEEARGAGPAARVSSGTSASWLRVTPSSWPTRRSASRSTSSMR